MINFRISLGSWLFSIKACKRSDCRFLKFEGITYMLQPQAMQKTRVSVFLVERHKDDYLCGVGHTDKRYNSVVPYPIYYAAFNFSKELDRAERAKRAQHY